MSIILRCLKKSQVVQTTKRSGSTMTSHFGFNSLFKSKIKYDKIVAGIVFWLSMIPICILLSSSFIGWFHDDQPYITSVMYPWNTTWNENVFKWETTVPLKDLNKIWFKVMDYKYDTYSMEDMAEYLNFKLIKLEGQYDEDGQTNEVPTTYWPFHTC